MASPPHGAPPPSTGFSPAQQRPRKLCSHQLHSLASKVNMPLRTSWTAPAKLDKVNEAVVAAKWAGGDVAVHSLEAPLKIETSPDAPWISFIAHRSNLLSSFINFRRSCRSQPAVRDETVPDDTTEVQRAFARLSLALDRITVPHAYWSETPVPGIETPSQYEGTLTILDDLQRRFDAVSSRRSGDSMLAIDVGEDVARLLAEVKTSTEFFETYPARRSAAGMKTPAEEQPCWPNPSA